MSHRLTDNHGLHCTGPLGAMQGINDFCDGFVAYQPRSVNVLQAADEFADSALANIYAGMLWMFLERPEAPEKSIPYSLRAEKLRGLNEREKGLLSLLQAWQCYDFKKVITIGEALCAQFPRDLSLLKIVQYHTFNAGDATRMLKLALAGEVANAHRAPVHSMIAFGYEQSKEINLAEQSAHKALAIDSNEPWAHHALAHVHLSRGTTKDGLDILSSSAESWTDLNSFMFTHNWWHIALFEIANGDVHNALEIYDDRCWGIQPDYSQDQIGAVSLLARLEMAQVDVGSRWNDLLPFLETREDDVIQPFLCLQYLYGLAKAKSSKTDNLLLLIQQQAEQPIVEQDRTLWETVGIPVARGVVAHANNDYESVISELGAVRSEIWKIGGSHAQRDLFEQILLDAKLRAGHWEAARKTLEHRKGWEPESPLLHQRLNETYRQLNLK